jgi:hypothetical protein
MRGTKQSANLYGDAQRPVMGDPDTPNPSVPDLGTTGHGSRMLSPLSMAAPVQQLTPNQRAFRDSVANGRWQADFDAGANSPANRMVMHDDAGTVDTIRMEADGDQWIDLGGRGATDVAIGRP